MVALGKLTNDRGVMAEVDAGGLQVAEAMQGLFPDRSVAFLARRKIFLIGPAVNCGGEGGVADEELGSRQAGIDKHALMTDRVAGRCDDPKAFGQLRVTVE